MEFTEKEKQYIDCLSVGMPFEQIMRELNMSREELGKFGPELLDRILEISAVLRVPKARDSAA